MRALVIPIDERLMVEAAQRDPSRFAELYEHNFERVYAFVVRRVRDRTTAEDITADVFHRALERIGSYECQGVPFSAWLLRIAANAITDRWRRLAKEPVSAAEEFLDPAVENDTERRIMLTQIVEGLPEDQRLVVMRRFVDQRRITEIAAELGRSEGAVKQLQFRALENLRARMRSTYE